MSPINNILVATDLSGENQNLLIYASEFAKMFGAKVNILYVNNVSVPAFESSSMAVSDNSQMFVKEEFEHIERDFFYPGNPKHEFINITGSVEEKIEEVVRERRIDLLIMGTEEPSAFMEVFGSHTSHLAAKIKVPLMIIPQNSPFKSIKKILYGCDLRKLSTHLELLNFIAQKYRAIIHIITLEIKLHVLNVDELITDRIVDHILEKSATKHLYFKEENIEDGIERYIKSNSMDLLVLNHHHHNVWEKITHKSITKNLLFHSEIPILILPE